MYHQKYSILDLSLYWGIEKALKRQVGEDGGGRQKEKTHLKFLLFHPIHGI